MEILPVGPEHRHEVFALYDERVPKALDSRLEQNVRHSIPRFPLEGEWFDDSPYSRQFHLPSIDEGIEMRGCQELTQIIVGMCAKDACELRLSCDGENVMVQNVEVISQLVPK